VPPTRHEEVTAVPILLALLTVAAGFVVGVVFFATGHIILGIVGCMAAIPVAFGVWAATSDRLGR
jgi:hypothetical protein